MVAGLMNGKPPAVISCIDIRTLKESVENKVNENDQHVFITDVPCFQLGLKQV